MSGRVCAHIEVTRWRLSVSHVCSRKETDCARQVQHAIEVAGDNDKVYRYPYIHWSFGYLRIESQNFILRSRRQVYHVIVPKGCPNPDNCRGQATCRRGMDDYKLFLSLIQIADLGVISCAHRFKMAHAVWLTGGESLTKCVLAYKLREGKIARLTPSPRCRNSGRCNSLSFKRRL